MMPVLISVALSTLDAAIANTALPTIAADVQAHPADAAQLAQAEQVVTDTLNTLHPPLPVAEVVACGSSEWKLGRLKEIGATYVIDTSREDILKFIHQKFGKPRYGGGGGVGM